LLPKQRSLYAAHYSSSRLKIRYARARLGSREGYRSWACMREGRVLESNCENIFIIAYCCLLLLGEYIETKKEKEIIGDIILFP
jgi:hypothetical protein